MSSFFHQKSSVSQHNRPILALIRKQINNRFKHKRKRGPRAINNIKPVNYIRDSFIILNQREFARQIADELFKLFIQISKSPMIRTVINAGPFLTITRKLVELIRARRRYRARRRLAKSTRSRTLKRKNV